MAGRSKEESLTRGLLRRGGAVVAVAGGGGVEGAREVLVDDLLNYEFNHGGEFHEEPT